MKALLIASLLSVGPLLFILSRLFGARLSRKERETADRFLTSLATAYDEVRSGAAFECDFLSHDGYKPIRLVAGTVDGATPPGPKRFIVWADARQRLFGFRLRFDGNDLRWEGRAADPLARKAKVLMDLSEAARRAVPAPEARSFSDAI